jgi:carbon storage regulator CsrA
MLVLSRKSRESVEVGGADGWQPQLKVTVLEIRAGTVTLGFDAAADVPILRSEVSERIRTGAQPSSPVPQATVLGPQLFRELSRDNKKPGKVGPS